VYFGLPFAMVILCVTLVPFFYRAGVFTAYEYLEKRFDGRTRTLTSLLFLCSRGLSVGVTLYAPLARPVRHPRLERAGDDPAHGRVDDRLRHVRRQQVRDLDGRGPDGHHLVRDLPVLRGGPRADPRPIRFRDALALAQATGRLHVMDTSPSLTTPYTLWSGVIAGTFLMLSYFGCDQSQVQRYLSGSSLAQSRLSLLFNAFLKVPMQFLILLTGVLVFVFYHFHPPPLLWNPVELAKLERLAPPPSSRR
jgi:Na+/proline symporter